MDAGVQHGAGKLETVVQILGSVRNALSGLLEPVHQMAAHTRLQQLAAADETSAILVNDNEVLIQRLYFFFGELLIDLARPVVGFVQAQELGQEPKEKPGLEEGLLLRLRRRMYRLQIFGVCLRSAGRHEPPE
jgi:hypothetical protein